jgi:hypothetical protein
MSALQRSVGSVFRPIALVALAATAVVTVGLGTAATAAQGTRTTVPDAETLLPLKVLGGPVAASGRLLAITVTASHGLQLTAVNPSTSKVTWQHAYSASYMTLGQAFEPVAIGGVAIDLAPTGAPTNPTVEVKGIDLSTGDVAWTWNVKGTVSDAPVACVGEKDFCFSWAPSSAASHYGEGLVELSASSGSVLRVVRGSERELGANLYQTTAATATLIQIGTGGTLAWRKAASSIFGSSADNPNGGWNVDELGSVGIGSLGLASNSTTVDTSTYSTTGFLASSGRRLWRDQGTYNCVGSLEFLRPPVICRMSGSFKEATKPDSIPSFAHVKLTIEGFNQHTGAVTWSRRVANVQAIFSGTRLAFVDDKHIEIETTSGAYEVLDTASGSMHANSPGEVFWCESLPILDVTAPAGSAANIRVGTYQYFGCSAKGSKVAGLPRTQPSAVGVRLAGRFFWSTSKGIEGIPTS